MTPGQIDFSLAPAMAAAACNALLFPIYLLATTFAPALAQRHALRFLCSSLILLGLQAGMFLVPALAPANPAQLIACAAVALGAIIFYLQCWALMTRGYTLGILLTLLSSEKPLSADEIFTRYRGGDGLGWIMRHRLTGLCSSGLIRQDADRLSLSPGRGVLVAQIYRACVMVLGLKRTG
jgi:hypothetical protein